MCILNPPLMFCWCRPAILSRRNYNFIVYSPDIMPVNVAMNKPHPSPVKPNSGYRVCYRNINESYNFFTCHMHTERKCKHRDPTKRRLNFVPEGWTQIKTFLLVVVWYVWLYYVIFCHHLINIITSVRILPVVWSNDLKVFQQRLQTSNRTCMVKQ